MRARPRYPARLLRRGVQRLGLHPDQPARDEPPVRLPGARALVIATNHPALEVGRPTGVFASELTVPYYAFLDAGLEVDLASPAGGPIPVDPLSVNPVLRTAADDRMLGDPELRALLTHSAAVADLGVDGYDLLYLAGGWGAAFDFVPSRPLAEAVTAAFARGLLIGGVCHGPLGLVGASAPDGRPLVSGRRLTAVTDRQVRQLGISATPYHPETELRRHGARYEAARHPLADVLADHWVVDGTLVTGQNQNAAPAVAAALLGLLAERRTAAAIGPTPAGGTPAG